MTFDGSWGGVLYRLVESHEQNPEFRRSIVGLVLDKKYSVENVQFSASHNLTTT